MERPSVTTSHRTECIRQLLRAQGEGLFLLVCRSAYPEIEAIAREYIRDNSDFSAQIAGLSSKEGANKIRNARQKLFSETDSLLMNLSITDLGGILGVEVTAMLLEKVFASCWSEDDLDEQDRAVSRHYHAHGYPLDAAFKDGLNAILLLDAAMHAFDALKRSNESPMEDADNSNSR